MKEGDKCRMTGKVRFSTRIEAELVIIALHRMLKRKDENGKRIKHRSGKPVAKRAYFCQYCNGYHVTRWKKRDFNSYLEKRDKLDD